ncbi:hypothetical protein PC113_g5984 [Phytophthora cactorum]|uniref:Uncharacterized protein n=1 Tax=Phytophthora cactorum TaxID=29920 RepID=A0A8T0ZK70_9STRA|nr:hypothetical protein PC113_g5984 [Phytophthora cactorum]KAG2925846.1 hypothetical protein PC115_g8072 [Phytophthora cactorum]
MTDIDEAVSASSDINDALSNFLTTPGNDHHSMDQGNARLQQVPVDSEAPAVSNRNSSTDSTAGPSFWPANAAIRTSKGPSGKPKKKRRRDRNRPIHEINRLQLQVKEMEKQLKTLTPEDSSELQALKEKNEALKEKVKESVESSTKVGKLLQTQADQLLQALPKSLTVSGDNLVYDLVEDDAVFQALARTVDDHYMDMDRVLGDAGVRDATTEIFDARVSRPTSMTDSDCVLKTRTCAFLPYSMKRVEKAMWRRLESESAILPKTVQSSRDLGLPLGTASNLMVSKRKVRLDDVSFTIRLVLKEFAEPDRLVYVWDAVGDWPQPNTALHVSTREYGWIYFEPGDSPNLSILRSLVLVRSTTTPTVDVKLLEHVMHLYRHTIEARYQKLENTLVDASICSKKASCVGDAVVEDVCCVDDVRRRLCSQAFTRKKICAQEAEERAAP